MKSCAERGPTPGVETPVIPDAVDAVDAGDVVAGLRSRPRFVNRSSSRRPDGNQL